MCKNSNQGKKRCQFYEKQFHVHLNDLLSLPIKIQIKARDCRPKPKIVPTSRLLSLLAHTRLHGEVCNRKRRAGGVEADARRKARRKARTFAKSRFKFPILSPARWGKNLANPCLLVGRTPFILHISIYLCMYCYCSADPTQNTIPPTVDSSSRSCRIFASHHTQATRRARSCRPGIIYLHQNT